MRENGLLAPHRVGRTEAKLHDGTIITDKVNEMWGTDMTQTITIREGRANVFVAVEHANSEVIGGTGAVERMLQPARNSLARARSKHSLSRASAHYRMLLRTHPPYLSRPLYRFSKQLFSLHSSLESDYLRLTE
jgi:hypothetical protein